MCGVSTLSRRGCLCREPLPLLREDDGEQACDLSGTRASVACEGPLVFSESPAAVRFALVSGVASCRVPSVPTQPGDCASRVLLLSFGHVRGVPSCGRLDRPGVGRSRAVVKAEGRGRGRPGARWQQGGVGGGPWEARGASEDRTPASPRRPRLALPGTPATASQRLRLSVD